MRNLERKFGNWIQQYEDILSIGLLIFVVIIAVLLWGIQLSPSFIPDALANFVSDVVAGVIIATLIGWWLSKRERREEQRDIQHNYLSSFKEEIESIIEAIPDARKIFNKEDWGGEVELHTPFWEMVRTSGDLPKLLGNKTSLLKGIGAFYAGVSYAKRGRDLMLSSWHLDEDKIKHIVEKRKMYKKMFNNGLNISEKYGRSTLEEIKKALNNLDS